MNNERKLIRLNLQYFGDGDGGDPQPVTEPQNTTEPKNLEKTYSQEQINSMMANEKRTARQALLKELGYDIKDEKSFKPTLEAIKKTLDSTKSQAQIDAEAKANAENARLVAETKVATLEAKVAALSSGVNPESLEDVMAIAQAYVTEDKPIDKVLADLKVKYPIFFTVNSSTTPNSGTGKPMNPGKKSGGTENLGQRLAKTTKATAKSSYFKNN